MDNNFTGISLATYMVFKQESFGRGESSELED